MQRKRLACWFAAMTLTAIGGCENNPATGRSQLIMVSSSQLDAMGAEAAPMLVEEYGGEVDETQLRQYVTRVGNRIAENVEPEYAEIDWQFIVLDTDVLNAFALPGGRVFISRGLMSKFTNEAQVAAVLGHEIGHVTGRHVDERISRATAVDLGLQIGGSMTESDIAVAAADLFGQGYILKFGRDQELEADRLGLRYMAEAGYDPYAMLDVIRVLMEAGSDGAPPEILSTHPEPEKRLERVTQILNDEYRDLKDNPEYGLFGQRFRNQALPHLRPSGD